MLVRNFGALLCSGVLAASALKIAALEDFYDSAVESTFDAQQIPFGASSQEGVQEVLGDSIDNDVLQLPQKAEDKTIYQVLSDNPK
jgi:hypothetical protein